MTNKNTIRRYSIYAQIFSGFIGTLIALLGFTAVSLGLYMQYSETVKKNEGDRIAREIQRIDMLVFYLTNEIEMISVHVDLNGKLVNLTGADAIEYMSDAFLNIGEIGEDCLKNSTFNQIFFACAGFDAIIDRIDSANLGATEKRFYSQKLAYLYSSRLEKALLRLEAGVEKAIKDGNIDKIPESGQFMLKGLIRLNKRMHKLFIDENL